MNSSATHAHLTNKLGALGHQLQHSTRIAGLKWNGRGSETQAWHRENARKSLERIARIEHACIYLRQRMERARGCDVCGLAACACCFAVVTRGPEMYVKATNGHAVRKQLAQTPQRAAQLMAADIERHDPFIAHARG